MAGPGRLAGAAYVAVVALVAAYAFSDPHGSFSVSREGVALLLVFPMILAALPAVYLAGATIWNLTGADHGGPLWAVPLGYAVVFALVALGNWWLIGAVFRRLRRSTAS